MSGARTATLGFVLSTTTDRPEVSDSEMSCSCRRCGRRLLPSRSLLTWSCVPAKRSRKNVDLPDAGNPIRITHSIVTAGQTKPAPAGPARPALHYRDLTWDSITGFRILRSGISRIIELPKCHE